MQFPLELPLDDFVINEEEKGAIYDLYGVSVRIQTLTTILPVQISDIVISKLKVARLLQH